ncbi:MAG: hypothetical protein QW158_04480 [Nitrososphaerales archaeon]
MLRNFAATNLGVRAGALGLLTHRAPSAILGLDSGSLLSILVDELCLASSSSLFALEPKRHTTIEESRRRIERRRRLWSSESL